MAAGIFPLGGVLTPWCSYLRAYNMIRSITGLGAGNGPVIALHDGFAGVSSWAGFLAGADRVALGESVPLPGARMFADIPQTRTRTLRLTGTRTASP